ncbi:T9SS type A sorting domain-containing protein [Bacteroidota bacterium]
MKKITLKFSAFLLLMMFALQVQGQALYTEEGTYKISTSGISPVLYITINGSTGALEWAEELPNNNPTQVWTIKNHRTPASAGLMEIWATIPGVGNFTMATDDDSASPSLTLVARAGDPVSVAELTGDYSGLDQFQRRKTKVNAEGLYDAAGANPSAGNNAIFLRNTVTTTSRYGVVPSAAGDAVKFDGGGIDVIQFHLIAPLLSTDDEVLKSNALKAYPNPSSNGQYELNVDGAWTVYSLVGAELLQGNGKNVDLSAFPKGAYVLKTENSSKVLISK